jgi:hypothetical protein
VGAAAGRGVGRDAASAVASAGCAVTERAELVSHCDYYPGNVVFRGERPVALIDFDLAHPTTRLYESRTLWYWAPLRDPRDPAAPAPPEARLRTGPLSLPVVSGCSTGSGWLRSRWPHGLRPPLQPHGFAAGGCRGLPSCFPAAVLAGRGPRHRLDEGNLPRF